MAVLVTLKKLLRSSPRVMLEISSAHNVASAAARFAGCALDSRFHRTLRRCVGERDAGDEPWLLRFVFVALLARSAQRLL